MFRFDSRFCNSFYLFLFFVVVDIVFRFGLVYDIENNIKLNDQILNMYTAIWVAQFQEIQRTTIQKPLKEIALDS